MTALAAVIALSSTPLLAQIADEPVVTTTPITDVTPEPVAADPVADTTAADPLAAEATPATPARKATPVKTAAKARPAATRAASAPVAAAPPAAAPEIAAPAETLPIEPPAALAAPPVVAETPAAPADTTMNEMLPVAGAGGLALVLLAGTGLAIRRRRRRRAQEAEDLAWQQDAELAPEPVADPVVEPAMVAESDPELELTRPVFATPVEPAFAVAPTLAAAAPAAAEPTPQVDGPVTDLPDNFDLSRFGFNVQQAYKGPTEDNPSLSLKHRLRRASGMDQQERKLEAEVEAATGESPLADAEDATPIAKPDDGTPAKGDFMLARDGKQPASRPALTH